MQNKVGINPKKRAGLSIYYRIFTTTDHNLHVHGFIKATVVAYHTKVHTSLTSLILQVSYFCCTAKQNINLNNLILTVQNDASILAVFAILKLEIRFLSLDKTSNKC